jgi:hypothetical protein
MRSRGQVTADVAGGRLVPGLDAGAPYSSTLSARSALYTDLQLLLDDRAEPLTAEEYRNLVLDGNCLSRGSTAARQKIWSELRKRYPLDRRNPLFNAFWQEWRRSQTDQERALTTYVAFALNDRLVAHIGTEWLCPYLRRAPAEVRVGDLRAFLEQSGRENHPELLEWTDSTKHKVAKHFLASVRDFGLAQGRAVKKSIRPALYGAPVRLLIRVLRMSGARDLEIISAPIFRLLSIEGAEIIESLGELNRQGQLRFRMQADVVELQVGGAQ